MIAFKKLKNKGIIAFLLTLIITIGFLSYQNNSDYAELKEAFEVEKNELEFELNQVIEDYQEVSYDKVDVSLKLNKELQKIIELRDTIHNLKATDYGLINVYRKRISNLAEENKLLFTYIDSLNSVNNQLLTKNDSVQKALQLKENQNIKLQSKNYSLDKEKKILKKKMAKVEVIETSTIKLKAMKKRKNGKYTSTSRSSKTDAFKIEFDLLENKFINPGNKNMYVQILDTNENIIAPLKTVRLKNKKKIVCSDVLVVNYYNKLLSVMSLINVKRENINKGKYTANVFVNGIFAKSISIKLK